MNQINRAPAFGIQHFFETLEQRSYSKLVILVDSNTEQHCLPVIEKGLGDQFSDAEILLVPEGEASKSIQVLSSLWQSMISLGIDRNALFVNLGGGVITDLGGFTAATYKRGIPFIHIPTSLLAMVDGAIGGKTGINVEGYKNQAGVFAMPEHVIIERDFLKTLPERELTSGFAELYKHALISGGLLYEEVKKITAPTPETFTVNLLRETCRVKTNIVESDFTEKGLRKVLNLGHTIGHAVETGTMGSENELKHGEAVAVGIAIENFMAESVTGLSHETSTEILEKLTSLYPNAFALSFEPESIYEICTADKKNENKTPSFSLLQAPGKVLTGCTPDKNTIISAIERYNEL